MYASGEASLTGDQVPESAPVQRRNRSVLTCVTAPPAGSSSSMLLFSHLVRNLQPTTRHFDVRNSGKGTLAPKRLQQDGLEVFQQMHKIICQFPW